MGDANESNAREPPFSITTARWHAPSASVGNTIGLTIYSHKYMIMIMDKHSTAWQSRPYRVRLAAGGRIVIPAEVRQLLGIQVGEELLLNLDEVGFRLTTSRQAIRQAQSLFAKMKGEGESVVEELLRERRDEAAKEEREFRDARE